MDYHKEARERYEDACSVLAYQRDMMREALRFSAPAAPEQWTPEELKARGSRKNPRPALVFDRSNQYIYNVVNQYRQNKIGTETMPVDGGADSKTAQVYDGIIKHIEYQSRASIARETAADHMVRCGQGWTVILPVVATDGSIDIAYKRVIDPLSCIIDPSCTEPDGLGAKWGYWTHTISEKEFERKYGKKADKTEFSTDKSFLWFGEKEITLANSFEVSERKKTRLLVDIDGQERTYSPEQYTEIAQKLGYEPIILSANEVPQKYVKWCLLGGNEILEESEISCQHLPIVPYVGDEIMVDGRVYRSGMVHKLMSGQRLYNHILNLKLEFLARQPKAPFIAPAQAIAPYQNEWASLNDGNPSVLPWQHIDASGKEIPGPQKLEPSPMPQAFLNLEDSAVQVMEASIGMFQPNLGKPGAAVSGKAKLADKNEGDTNTFNYQDNAIRSAVQEGRILVDMIPNYYREKKIARIIGEDNRPSTVQLAFGSGGPKTQGKKVLSVDLDAGRYDVRAVEGAKSTTQREEAAQALTEIMQANQVASAALGPALVKLLDIPDADKYSKMMMALAPPEVQKAAAEFENESAEVPPQVMAEMQMLQQQAQEMQMMLQEAQQALQEADEKIQAAESALKELQANKAIEAARLELDAVKLDLEIERAATGHEFERDKFGVEQSIRELEKNEREEKEGAGEEQMQALLQSNAELAEKIDQLTAIETAPKKKEIRIEQDELGLPARAVITETVGDQTTTNVVEFNKDDAGLPVAAEI